METKISSRFYCIHHHFFISKKSILIECFADKCGYIFDYKIEKFVFVDGELNE